MLIDKKYAGLKNTYKVIAENHGLSILYVYEDDGILDLVTISNIELCEKLAEHKHFEAKVSKEHFQQIDEAIRNKFGFILFEE